MKAPSIPRSRYNPVITQHGTQECKPRNAIVNIPELILSTGYQDKHCSYYFMVRRIILRTPGVAGYTCDPSTGEVEARGLSNL